MSRREGSVEPRPSESLFDPDLDPPPQRLSQLSSESIEDHLRLIVNPFLAVLGWVIVLVIIRMALQIRSPVWFLTGLGLSVVPPFFFQYHCLDCGATGWLQSCWRHRCPAVTNRAQNGIVRRFRGLSVKNQVVAWINIVLAVFLMYFILVAGRR
jgi:hypothetical protein